MLHHRLRCTPVLPIELTFVAVATNDSGDTISVPESAQSGDLLVLFDRAIRIGTGSIGPPAVGIPTGATQVTTESFEYSTETKDYGIRQTVSYVISTGVTTLSGMNSTEETKVLLVFRPSRPISGISIGSLQVSNSASAPGSKTVSAQATAGVVLAVYGTTGSSKPWSSKSPASTADYTIYTTDFCDMIVSRWMLSSPSNVTVSRTVDDGQSNIIQAFALNVS